ncbi:MAG: Universal stress protein UspA [Labilithrix sp.]|jgi:nucleotide-binding universal stress UspA family protein|nr:Universal stress protein UspA [Labilithrix sp.]
MAMRTESPPTPVVYVVAIDGAPSSEHVLEVACGLGKALGGAAELHLVHVLAITPPAAIAAMGPLMGHVDLPEVGCGVLDAASAHAAMRFHGRIVGHLAAGEPSREITQIASDMSADLVVIGTAGKTGLARLALGSVAEKVVRNAGCPVLVVRPKDVRPNGVPEIEPPCGDCIAVQSETARAKLWCDRHSTHHVHGRLHYEVPPTFAMGSMNFRP